MMGSLTEQQNSTIWRMISLVWITELTSLDEHWGYRNAFKVNPNINWVLIVIVSFFKTDQGTNLILLKQKGNAYHRGAFNQYASALK